ncbi:biotin--[acetyl-CoA-carboxylase] ligase [Lachnospiraceae bacterium MD308]|nr:biotin--[acetyl-CoA-carboxylase] ligase [Lachnospiraceae bacterium MD308]
MKNEILRLLKTSDTYISGQQLCGYFKVSRTSVWKVMEQLKKEGYEIEAVRNRGYRLVSSPDVISEAEIKSLLGTEWAGRKVVYYDETDSTNNRAKDSGEKNGAHGTLFIADKQNAGKGRRGRAWESPSGKSIYMTILLRPQITPDKAPMLTLIMGLSVAEGIRKVSGAETEIKWPNDIVMNKKKVCGILTEMATEMEYVNYVVIGVGINVNQEYFSEGIKEIATSLYEETGTVYQRSELIAAVLERFEKNYEMFLETGDLSAVRKAYDSILVNRGQEVKVLEPGNEYRAVAEGINKNGELIVRLSDGRQKNIFAGEVSVRGIYGYV